jgi:hypothetical protein
VKFSTRQILASATGAVLAALIASTFGVTGTIIGVAIGSCVATMGTALVSQSIERGHRAVKQAVVRAPDDSLIRRLGGTVVSGGSAESKDSGVGPTEAVAPASGSFARTEESAVMEPPMAGGADTRRFEVSAVADAPQTERLEAVTLPVEPVQGGRRGLRLSWRAFAGTAAAVFVLALLFVTAIELISGQPLSAIFGHHGTGPSVERIFVPSSPGPATTTTTTVPASTTTTTAGASTTTTGSTTTTTVPTTGGSTTTTGPGTTGTTTTTAVGATTTTG